MENLATLYEGWTSWVWKRSMHMIEIQRKMNQYSMEEIPTSAMKKYALLGLSFSSSSVIEVSNMRWIYFFSFISSNLCHCYIHQKIN